MNEGVLNYLRRSIPSSMNICTVAKIINIDTLGEGFVTVQPLVNSVDSVDKWDCEMPTIGYVPVIMPSTLSCGVVLPIKVGDTCLLVFGQTNLDEFKMGASDTHTPINQRTNDLSDAVAFVGFNTTQTSIYRKTNHAKGYNNGSVKVFNNLGTGNENFVELKQDGDVVITSPNIINAVDAKNITATDFIVEGVGSVKEFMLGHKHKYTDDGSVRETDVPILP